MKSIKNKIGYCRNKHLKGVKGKKNKGHYVYIRQVNVDGTCDVNVITSLEDKDKNITPSKIKQVRRGNTYPIPYYDANFTRWSGVNKTPIKNVNQKYIKDIGKKKIKKRHYFFINKFMK